LSELISSVALGLILLVIVSWVGFWVFVGYFVAGSIKQDLNTGMIYGATLGPLGVALLLIGHFVSPDISGVVLVDDDAKSNRGIDFSIGTSEDPLS
jgi:hypothetical protein